MIVALLAGRIGQSCQGFSPKEMMEDKLHMARVGWHGVQGFHVLLLFVFLVDDGNIADAETKAKQYIKQKETQVKLIAKSAVTNAGLCDYLATCQQSSSCSIAVCFQTVSDVQHSKCVGVTNNTDCACLTEARAHYSKSYVRVPGLGNRQKMVVESVTTICVQHNLDLLTFVNRNSDFVYEYDHKFYSFYLGTVDAIKDCNDYDPRVRPWYIGAIYVIKDLVVLVDAASSMSNLKVFADRDNNGTTASALAISMAERLLDTITQGDRATVMAYYSNGLLSLNSLYTVPPPAAGISLNLTLNSDFVKLRTSVSNIGTAGITDPSNTTAAILQALQVLGNARSPTGALKVIVVLTNGQSPVPQEPRLDGLVCQLDTSTTTLFVYQIDGIDVGLAGLASALSRGRNEKVNFNPSTILNPLYALKSYFSFLANARNSSGTDSYYWQPSYLDYDFLGHVRTVAYPAISPTGDLVGVAGIDIQVSKIDPNIALEIEIILNNQKVNHPPTISSSQIPIFDASNAGESSSCNGSTLDPSLTYAVCQGNESELQLPYSDRLCCGWGEPAEAPAEAPADCSLSRCNEHKELGNLTALWVYLGILPCLGLAGCFLCWRKTTKTAGLQRPLPNPSGGFL